MNTYFKDPSTGLNNGMTYNQRRSIANTVSKDIVFSEFAYLVDCPLTKSEASVIIGKFKAVKNLLNSFSVSCLQKITWEDIMNDVRATINEIAPIPVVA